MPLLWAPRIHEAAILPVRNGSSEKYSEISSAEDFECSSRTEDHVAAIFQNLIALLFPTSDQFGYSMLKKGEPIGKSCAEISVLSF